MERIFCSCYTLFVFFFTFTFSKHLKQFNITIKAYIKILCNVFTALFAGYFEKIIATSEVCNDSTALDMITQTCTFKKHSCFYRHFEKKKNLSAILFFIKNFSNHYYWKLWEKTEWPKVIIILHIENHICQKEKVVVLKTVAAIFPKNNLGISVQTHFQCFYQFFFIQFFLLWFGN